MNDPPFNKLVDILVSGVISVISSGLLVAGFLIYLLYKPAQVITTDATVVPHFQRGDCFEGNWERESWENLSTPDGIIERVGKKNYLIIFREAATKKGGNKYASSMSIVTFDSNNIQVPCPITWTKHTHERAK